MAARIADSDFEQKIIALQQEVVSLGGTIPVKLRVAPSDFEQQIIALQQATVALGGAIPIKLRIAESDFEQQILAIGAFLEEAGAFPGTVPGFTINSDGYLVSNADGSLWVFAVDSDGPLGLDPTTNNYLIEAA